MASESSIDHLDFNGAFKQCHSENPLKWHKLASHPIRNEPYIALKLGELGGITDSVIIGQNIERILLKLIDTIRPEDKTGEKWNTYRALQMFYVEHRNIDAIEFELPIKFSEYRDRGLASIRSNFEDLNRKSSVYNLDGRYWNEFKRNYTERTQDGRSLVDAVVADIKSGEFDWIELTGEPGVGKTTIAYQVGVRARPSISYALAVVGVRAKNHDTVMKLLDRIGKDIGHQDVEEANSYIGKCDLIHDEMEKRDHLLIIDDFDILQLQPDWHVFQYFLTSLPARTICVVTASSLDPTVESAVVPSFSPRQKKLVPVRPIDNPIEAFEFMRQKAAIPSPPLHLSDEVLKEIFRRSSGYPSLMLAYLAQVSDGRGLPTPESIDDLTVLKHLVYSWQGSYERLNRFDPNARNALHVLNLFKLSAQVKAVGWALNLTDGQTRNALAVLRNHYFALENIDEDSFTLPDHIRDFLRELEK